MHFRRALLLAIPCLVLAQPDKPLPVPEEEVQRVVREVFDLARAEDPEWGAETLFRLSRVLKNNYPQLAETVREASRKRAAEIGSATTRAGYLAMLLTDDKSARVTPEQVAGACLAVPQDSAGSNEPAFACLRSAYENFRTDGVTAYELVFLRAALSLGRVSAFPASDILRRQPQADSIRFLDEYVRQLNPEDMTVEEINALLPLLAMYPPARKELLPPALGKLARALPRLPESPACTLTIRSQPLRFDSPRTLFAFQFRKLAEGAHLVELLEQIPDAAEPPVKEPLDALTVEHWLAAEVVIPNEARAAEEKREQDWSKFMENASSDKLPEPLAHLPFPEAWEKIESESNSTERLSRLCSLARRAGGKAERLETVKRARLAVESNDNELVRATAQFFLASAVAEGNLDGRLAGDLFKESLAGLMFITGPILKGERPYLHGFPTNYEELTSMIWLLAMTTRELNMTVDHPSLKSRLPILGLQSRFGESGSFFSLAP
jgi:hypothetical protein